jgi:beta-1,4-mannosyltransferase
MQYHAHALAASGVDVDFIGYAGAPLPKAITDHPRITIRHIGQARLRDRVGRSSILYALAAMVDGTHLATRLLVALLRAPKFALLLVQNPPALPTLHVAWLASRLRRARLVVDWHNLGYTILAMRLGHRHPAVRLGRWLERIAGRAAHANLCVSRGFSKFLIDRFHLSNVRVLYDRPASAFVPVERVEREQIRQALFTRLGIRGAGPVGFIVSPTGWTADEDFDVVIDAVVQIEDRIRGWEAGGPSRRFPDLVILVTGDGARCAEFERRFAGLPRGASSSHPLAHPEDYPHVGSADLGLCLHRSRVDIPMKVVDLTAPASRSVRSTTRSRRTVRPANGLLFSTARQLADVLFDLFETLPAGPSLLDRLRSGARRAARPTWEEGWTTEAKPVLLGGN